MGRIPICLLWTTIVAWVVTSGLSAAELRTWVDITGKHEITAELVQTKSGWVQLKKPDGELVALQVEKLSMLDQAHVARLASSNDAEPAEQADAPKTGRFSTSFEQYSPLTTIEQILTRTMAPTAAATEANRLRAKTGGKLDGYPYDVSKETWEIYVPEDYDDSLPYGLFVFIDSSDEGAPRLKGWQDVLKKHRLIWAGPNDAGNKKDPVLRRIPLAVEAVHNLSLQYNIDPQRVYISGNSGGGRAASWAAMAYADVFTGGQYHVGANSYRMVKLPDGSPFPGMIHIPSPQLFKNAQQQHRYAFITGDNDFNKGQMKAVHQAHQQDGFRFAHYFQIPGGKHGPPPTEWFEKGIVALDAPLKELAPAAFKQAQELDERGQYGEALTAYRQAAAHGADQPFAAEAQQRYAALQTQFREYVADIEQLIKMDERQAATKEIAKLRKTWGEPAAAEAKRLAEALRGG